MERYGIVKDIGAGNFGVAKLVKDKWTRELFAVKFIERGQKIEVHVQREIMNHRSLKHPNIIRFKEVLLTATHLAIVMEYAAGVELFDRICNAGRLSEDEEISVLRQICLRDLKLENTLVDGSTVPHMKICNFGSSKSSVLQSQPKSTVGTPAYIASEVLSKKEYNGKRITITEIKNYPWFLKHLPIELMEGESWQSHDVNNLSQSMQEVLCIVQEARKLIGVNKYGGNFTAGGMDLYGLDADADLEDVATSGDFVCPL